MPGFFAKFFVTYNFVFAKVFRFENQKVPQNYFYGFRNGSCIYLSSHYLPTNVIKICSIYTNPSCITQLIDFQGNTTFIFCSLFFRKFCLLNDVPVFRRYTMYSAIPIFSPFAHTSEAVIYDAVTPIISFRSLCKLLLFFPLFLSFRRRLW